MPGRTDIDLLVGFENPDIEGGLFGDSCLRREGGNAEYHDYQGTGINFM